MKNYGKNILGWFLIFQLTFSALFSALVSLQPPRAAYADTGSLTVRLNELNGKNISYPDETLDDGTPVFTFYSGEQIVPRIEMTPSQMNEKDVIFKIWFPKQHDQLENVTFVTNTQASFTEEDRLGTSGEYFVKWHYKNLGTGQSIVIPLTFNFKNYSTAQDTEQDMYFCVYDASGKVLKNSLRHIRFRALASTDYRMTQHTYQTSKDYHDTGKRLVDPSRASKSDYALNPVRNPYLLNDTDVNYTIKVKPASSSKTVGMGEYTTKRMRIYVNADFMDPKNLRSFQDGDASQAEAIEMTDSSWKQVPGSYTFYKDVDPKLLGGDREFNFPIKLKKVMYTPESSNYSNRAGDVVKTLNYRVSSSVFYTIARNGKTEWYPAASLDQAGSTASPVCAEGEEDIMTAQIQEAFASYRQHEKEDTSTSPLKKVQNPLKDALSDSSVSFALVLRNDGDIRIEKYSIPQQNFIFASDSRDNMHVDAYTSEPKKRLGEVFPQHGYTVETDGKTPFEWKTEFSASMSKPESFAIIPYLFDKNRPFENITPSNNPLRNLFTRFERGSLSDSETIATMANKLMTESQPERPNLAYDKIWVSTNWVDVINKDFNSKEILENTKFDLYLLHPTIENSLGGFTVYTGYDHLYRLIKAAKSGTNIPDSEASSMKFNGYKKVTPKNGAEHFTMKELTTPISLSTEDPAGYYPVLYFDFLGLDKITEQPESLDSIAKINALPAEKRAGILLNADPGLRLQNVAFTLHSSQRSPKKDDVTIIHKDGDAAVYHIQKDPDHIVTEYAATQQNDWLGNFNEIIKTEVDKLSELIKTDPETASRRRGDLANLKATIGSQLNTEFYVSTKEDSSLSHRNTVDTWRNGYVNFMPAVATLDLASSSNKLVAVDTDPDPSNPNALPPRDVQLTFKGTMSGGIDGVAQNLKGVVLLPRGVHYVKTIKKGKAQGEPSIIDNYKDSGQTALVYNFGDQRGPECTGEVSYQLALTSDSPEKVFVHTWLSWDNPYSVYANQGASSDAYDLNENRKTDDILDHRSNTISLLKAQVSSIRKLVSTSCDDNGDALPPENASKDNDGWLESSRFVEIDGKFYYKLNIRNTGNTPITKLEIIDILPSYNDYRITKSSNGSSGIYLPTHRGDRVIGDYNIALQVLENPDNLKEIWVDKGTPVHNDLYKTAFTDETAPSDFSIETPIDTREGGDGLARIKVADKSYTLIYHVDDSSEKADSLSSRNKPVYLFTPTDLEPNSNWKQTLAQGLKGMSKALYTEVNGKNMPTPSEQPQNIKLELHQKSAGSDWRVYLQKALEDFKPNQGSGDPLNPREHNGITRWMSDVFDVSYYTEKDVYDNAGESFVPDKDTWKTKDQVTNINDVVGIRLTMKKDQVIPVKDKRITEFTKHLGNSSNAEDKELLAAYIPSELHDKYYEYTKAHYQEIAARYTQGGSGASDPAQLVDDFTYLERADIELKKQSPSPQTLTERLFDSARSLADGSPIKTAAAALEAFDKLSDSEKIKAYEAEITKETVRGSLDIFANDIARIIEANPALRDQYPEAARQSDLFKYSEKEIDFNRKDEEVNIYLPVRVPNNESLDNLQKVYNSMAYAMGDDAVYSESNEVISTNIKYKVSGFIFKDNKRNANAYADSKPDPSQPNLTSSYNGQEGFKVELEKFDAENGAWKTVEYLPQSEREPYWVELTTKSIDPNTKEEKLTEHKKTPQKAQADSDSSPTGPVVWKSVDHKDAYGYELPIYHAGTYRVKFTSYAMNEENRMIWGLTEDNLDPKNDKLHSFNNLDPKNPDNSANDLSTAIPQGSTERYVAYSKPFEVGTGSLVYEGDKLLEDEGSLHAYVNAALRDNKRDIKIVKEGQIRPASDGAEKEYTPLKDNVSFTLAPVAGGEAITTNYDEAMSAFVAKNVPFGDYRIEESLSGINKTKYLPLPSGDNAPLLHVDEQGIRLEAVQSPELISYDEQSDLITIKNDLQDIKFKLVLNKFGIDNDEALGTTSQDGATFALYLKNGADKLPVGTPQRVKNGEITWQDLSIGDYLLYEVQPASKQGYSSRGRASGLYDSAVDIAQAKAALAPLSFVDLGETPLEFSLDTGTPGVPTEKFVYVQNDKGKANLRLHKIARALIDSPSGKHFAQDLTPMQGAKFTAYPISADKYQELVAAYDPVSGKLKPGQTRPELPTNDGITQTTDADGYAVWQDLVLGSYYVKETGVPANYLDEEAIYPVVLQNELQSYDANKPGTYYSVPAGSPETSIVNQALSTSLKVQKVDKANQALGGANLGLWAVPAADIDAVKAYDIKSGEAVAGKELSPEDAKLVALDHSNPDYTSEENAGVHSFNTIPQGYYYLSELSAPYGYMLSDKIYVIKLDEEQEDYSATDSYKIINEKLKTTLNFKKLGVHNEALSSAEFSLLKEGDNAAQELKASSATDGSFSFSDLGEGTYSLKETKAPNGYNKLAAINIVLSMNESGTKLEAALTQNDAPLTASEGVYTLTDRKKTAGFSLIKLDGTDATKKLAGAVFELSALDEATQALMLDESYWADEKLGATVSEDKATRSYTTNDQGEINWTSLPYGSYKIKEVSAPRGYAIKQGAEWTLIISEGSDGQTSYEISGPGVSDELKHAAKMTVANDLITTTLRFTKVGADNNPLSGAEFSLLKEGDNAAQELKASSATDGSFSFSNLTEGTYSLKETKAPSGYEFMKDASFTISRDENNRPVVQMKQADSTKAIPVGFDADAKTYHTEVIVLSDPVKTTSFLLNKKALGKGDFASLVNLEGASFALWVNKTPDGNSTVERLFGQGGYVQASTIDAQGNKKLLAANKSVIPAKYPSAETNLIQVFDLGKTAKLQLDNLPMGTYYLREIKAPNGYFKLNVVVRLTVQPNSQTGELEIKVDAAQIPEDGQAPAEEAYLPFDAWDGDKVLAQGIHWSPTASPTDDQTLATLFVANTVNEGTFPHLSFDDTPVQTEVKGEKIPKTGGQQSTALPCLFAGISIIALALRSLHRRQRNLQ